jgi:hypothetical protein
LATAQWDKACATGDARFWVRKRRSGVSWGVAGTCVCQESCGRKKGDRHLLLERPFGCFAQKVPVPFFSLAAGRDRESSTWLRAIIPLHEAARRRSYWEWSKVCWPWAGLWREVIAGLVSFRPCGRVVAWCGPICVPVCAERSAAQDESLLVTGRWELER